MVFEDFIKLFSAGIFLQIIAKLVRTIFLQNTTERLLLIIAASIVVKVKLANETVNVNVPISARSLNYLKGQAR